MPHIVLEYSQDLHPLPDFRTVFGAVHRVLADVAGAPVSNAKSRATAIDSFIAHGDVAAAMVHLDIRLMEGRSLDQKAEVSRACLDILVEAFAEASTTRELQTTVAITDLDRATYAKDPAGTIA